MRILSCILFLSCALVFGANGKSLTKGQVAYKVDLVSQEHHILTVTNGAFVIEATLSNVNNDVTSCDVTFSADQSKKLMSHEDAVLEVVGLDKVMSMLKNCQHTGHRTVRESKNDDKTFNHNLVKGKPFGGDFETGAPSGSGSHFAIYPGTKWCGYENVATSMDDLGVHNRTDACCRTHDHCPYYIDRFENKYHYFNAYPWTLSHCDCDQHLYDCLKSVDSPTSNKVGSLFFGLLNVQCFTFQHGEYCADHSSILSKLWCHKKVTGERAVMQTFPHKWSDESIVDSASDLMG